MKQRDFLLWLLLIPGLTIKGRFRIWQYMAVTKIANLSWQLILQISRMNHSQVQRAVAWKKRDNWHADWEQLKQEKYITICDSEYPKYLHECVDAPICLFYKGDLSLLAHPLVAIVGARQATNYSEVVLNSWIPQLIAAGLTTVSGLAYGVDELTHRHSINAGGKTIGVIGTGLNHTYPKRQDHLQRNVGQTGLLLSEYLPWEGPKKHHFPERNRIISGLSQVCVIIEAQRRSGSLITAMLALEQNRTVMALPGRIDEKNSRGTNELILAGAIPVISVSQIILEFQHFY